MDNVDLIMGRTTVCLRPSKQQTGRTGDTHDDMANLFDSKIVKPAINMTSCQ